MKAPPHPNQLKKLVREAGLNMQEVHRLTEIPESTLYYWSAGNGIIPRESRVLLAQIIGCEAQDLAPKYERQGAQPDDLASKTVETMDVGEKESPALRLSSSPILESNGFFSFGKYSTSFIVLDGDGTEVYHPENVRAFYNPLPTNFLEEIEKGKEEVEKESEEKGYWNGSIYHLEKYVISREPIHEHMKLSLWFRPTDYFSTLSKHRFLQKNSTYLSGHDWENIVPSLPIPMGIGLCLLTEDGYILLAHRGTKVAVHPGVYGAGCAEGLSRPLDRSTISEAPDFYRCACRGLSEEFGLLENIDYSVSDIQFLSFGADTKQVFYGLRGFIKLRRSSSEVINKWQSGVKDRIENKQLFALPFNPKDVCDFVFSHEPWGALVVIYHTLVHEFGREEVERVVSSY